MRSGFFAGLLLATVSAAAAFAQGAPIKLANVAELSGGGATVGAYTPITVTGCWGASGP